MLAILDVALLARTERFCHGWQRLTGLTNFWWARLLVVLFAVGLAGSVSFLPVGPLRSLWWVNVMMGGLMAVVSLPVYYRVERHYLEGSATAHFLTLSWTVDLFSRLFNASIIIMSAIAMSQTGYPAWWLKLMAALACLEAEMYVRCVVPLPPGKSKVREWLESLRPASQPVAIPAR